MRRLLASILAVVLVPSLALGQPARRNVKDADLGKKETSAAPDKSLAGDLQRKKAEKGEAAPALQYDQYRLGVELQVASKRHDQIESLKKIIALSPKDDQKERPDLLFRLGELYWEESKHFFFEANRQDDEYIKAMNRGDKAAQERAKAEKKELLEKSKSYSRLAVDQYSEIVQRHKDYKRSDEVLYFLGHNLMEAGEERKSLVAYKRLLEKHPKSKFVPDAHLAFGEYYFNNSKGKKDQLQKALESYKAAAAFPQNQVYAFAIYKQGWCYFNMGDFHKAMDMFKAVVLFGQVAGLAGVEKDGGKSGKSSLMREARQDYVRAYSRVGNAAEARSDFSKLTSDPEERFGMMKGLANLYYADGKDREAALTFNTLIKEKPLSPEAPGFQGKIVDCVLRAGNKKMTVEQVRRLVKITNDVKAAKVVKSDKDKQALEEAGELSERTLSNLAVNWHNEARKTRDEETFVFAHEIYGDYLTLFSESPKSYDLRFFWAELLNDNLARYEKAAEEYTKVVMQDVSRIEKGDGKTKPGKPGKYMANAAYNAILAWDEVVKKAEEGGKIKAEENADPRKKLKIPAQRQALLEACERYLKYVPQGDKRVEIAFKAANIYYRHNHFDEAVQRFSQIALGDPEYKFENGDRAAEVAANLILDSYNLLGDFAKVNEWARKFYNTEGLAQGKFREDLSQVIEQSAFKLVNQLEAKKEYQKAAEAYLSFVEEFPRSAIADKALFNASIDFFNARMLDRAIATRKRLVENYPKSEYVPASIYANGEAYEAVGDFAEAADAYEAYVAGYIRSQSKGGGGQAAAPKRRGKKGKAGASAKAPAKSEKQVWDESKAQIALFNAGVFRDGLGQYKAALGNREQYLELWPEAKDSEQVFLSIADLHEKNEAYGRAIKQLEEYEKQYGKDPNKMLLAEGRIARIYAEKLKRPKDARRLYARTLKYYEGLGGKGKKALDNTALDAVGRAHYAESEPDYRQYLGVRLKWRDVNRPQEFKASVQEKAKSLETVQKRYTQTVSFKAGDPAICALHRIGEAYDHFAKSLVDAPMPRGMPEEFQAEFRAQLEQQAQPVKDKAAEAFASAVAKSQELDVFNDCYRQSLEMLRTAYRPDQFPVMAEATAEVRGNQKTLAVGEGFLTNIQPIPVISQEQAARNKQQAALPQQKQFQNAPAEEAGLEGGDLPPGSNTAQRRTKKKAPDEEPEDAAPSDDSGSGSDEPEDVL